MVIFAGDANVPAVTGEVITAVGARFMQLFITDLLVTLTAFPPVIVCNGLVDG